MPISEPLQDRSRQTMIKLLDAAESLLQAKDFPQITVQEIVNKAGSSAGSFYARFSSKEALRDCLIDRYHDDLVAISAEKLDPVLWSKVPLAERAESFIAGVVSYCRERRGLMRMRYLYYLTETDGLPPQDVEKCGLFQDSVWEFFRPVMKEISHPEPEVALDFALQIVDNMASSAILFENLKKGSQAGAEDKIFVSELTRNFLSYLQPRRKNTRPKPMKE